MTILDFHPANTFHPHYLVPYDHPWFFFTQRTRSICPLPTICSLLLQFSLPSNLGTRSICHSFQSFHPANTFNLSSFQPSLVQSVTLLPTICSFQPVPSMTILGFLFTQLTRSIFFNHPFFTFLQFSHYLVLLRTALVFFSPSEHVQSVHPSNHLFFTFLQFSRYLVPSKTILGFLFFHPANTFNLSSFQPSSPKTILGFLFTQLTRSICHSFQPCFLLFTIFALPSPSMTILGFLFTQGTRSICPPSNHLFFTFLQFSRYLVPSMTNLGFLFTQGTRSICHSFQPSSLFLRTALVFFFSEHVQSVLLLPTICSFFLQFSRYLVTILGFLFTQQHVQSVLSTILPSKNSLGFLFTQRTRSICLLPTIVQYPLVSFSPREHVQSVPPSNHLFFFTIFYNFRVQSVLLSTIRFFFFTIFALPVPSKNSLGFLFTQRTRSICHSFQPSVLYFLQFSRYLVPSTNILGFLFTLGTRSICHSFQPSVFYFLQFSHYLVPSICLVFFFSFFTQFFNTFNFQPSVLYNSLGFLFHPANTFNLSLPTICSLPSALPSDHPWFSFSPGNTFNLSLFPTIRFYFLQFSLSSLFSFSPREHVQSVPPSNQPSVVPFPSMTILGFLFSPSPLTRSICHSFQPSVFYFLQFSHYLVPSKNSLGFLFTQRTRSICPSFQPSVLYFLQFSRYLVPSKNILGFLFTLGTRSICPSFQPSVLYFLQFSRYLVPSMTILGFLFTQLTRSICHSFQPSVFYFLQFSHYLVPSKNSLGFLFTQRTRSICHSFQPSVLYFLQFSRYLVPSKNIIGFLFTLGTRSICHSFQPSVFYFLQFSHYLVPSKNSLGFLFTQRTRSICPSFQPSVLYFLQFSRYLVPSMTILGFLFTQLTRSICLLPTIRFYNFFYLVPSMTIRFLSLLFGFLFTQRTRSILRISLVFFFTWGTRSICPSFNHLFFYFFLVPSKNILVSFSPWEHVESVPPSNHLFFLFTRPSPFRISLVFTQRTRSISPSNHLFFTFYNFALPSPFYDHPWFSFHPANTFNPSNHLFFTFYNFRITSPSKNILGFLFTQRNVQSVLLPTISNTFNLSLLPTICSLLFTIFALPSPFYDHPWFSFHPANTFNLSLLPTIFPSKNILGFLFTNTFLLPTICSFFFRYPSMTILGFLFTQLTRSICPRTVQSVLLPTICSLLFYNFALPSPSMTILGFLFTQLTRSICPSFQPSDQFSHYLVPSKNILGFLFTQRTRSNTSNHLFFLFTIFAPFYDHPWFFSPSEHVQSVLLPTICSLLFTIFLVPSIPSLVFFSPS
ncbi:unnamed protein product [Acanthosepion pharaonis]|uniref:Uncharacterized protein n=1 Tax=Acanthosepion pharaonis TaxID=158019 RepID=A0A812DCC3_ACAPH|nr:unnamed protein product [Sepia pharaonis]